MKPLKQPSALHPGNNQGFTLVETMIAMLLFTFGILAVMSMTLTSMNGFNRSRITCTEVNRTTLNIETLKEGGYNNANIFSGAGTPAAPVGTDGATVGYNDTDNTVVAETKLISIQNNALRGAGAGATYELYYTKPFIE